MAQHWTRFCLVLGLGLGLTGLATAQEPENPVAPERRLPPALAEILAQGQAGKEKKDGQKDPKKDEKPPTPPVDFAQAPPPAEAPLRFNPNMIGDFSGVTGLRRFYVPATATYFVPKIQGPIGQVPPGFLKVTQTVHVPVTVPVPLAGRGAIKLGENESPNPQDRVFFTYNYYNNTRGPSNGSEFARTESILVQVDGQSFPASLAIPGVAPPRLDLHREVVGFEKSFFDGAASFGMRLPLFQQAGAAPFADQDLGDLSVAFKVAPWLDRETGSVVSTGLMVTLPTGPDVQTVAGNIHPTLLQPFVGYFFQRGNLFLQGFTSLVVPTDSRDVTLWFNDVGVGALVYQANNRFLRTVAPTLEAHFSTPLNHHSNLDPISASDGVALTAGVHFGLGPRSILTLGLATPVTGPRPFDLEAVVQFNLRF